MKKLRQLFISLIVWLLSLGNSVWAEPIPFQEYERYPVLGTICDQLNDQIDKYMILQVSPENSYYFDVKKTKLFVDNIVTYSRYPVNPVNGMDNLRRYLRFLSHSLYIGNEEKEKDFELELIRTYPHNLYGIIYDLTDEKAASTIYGTTSSVSIYICNLSNIKINNKIPMKDRSATLALYLAQDNRLIGYDFLGSEELQRRVANKNKHKNDRLQKDWHPKTGWQNYIYLPVDLGICVKQTVGEVIKSPLHLVFIPIANFILSDIEASDDPWRKLRYAGKLGVKTFCEDVEEIRYIWLYRLNKLNHRHKLKHLPLNLICEPIRELPLIGDHIPRDTHYTPAGTQTPGYLFISRGIYGRSADEQDTKNWEQFMRNILIEDINTKEMAACKAEKIDGQSTRIDQTAGSVTLQVSSIPYQYGSILDVLWSLLNISSGYGYEMAYRMVSEYEIGPGDVIFLTGHSGGVQRCLTAEKLLLENQIHVQRRAGLAGPSQGIVYWSRNKNSQNYISFLNQNQDYKDIVSQLNAVLDKLPPMCFSNWIWKRNEERILLADPTLQHVTPGIINPKTRIPASGYLGKEYINFFSNSYVGEQLVKERPVHEKQWWQQMPLPRIFKKDNQTKK